MADFIQGLEPTCFFRVRDLKNPDQNLGFKILSLVQKSNYLNFIESFLDAQSSEIKTFFTDLNFSPEPGKLILMPGLTLGILADLNKNNSVLESLALFYDQLPAGDYEIRYLDKDLNNLSSQDQVRAYVGWGLHAYQFNRYKLDKEQLNKNLKRLSLSPEIYVKTINYLKAHYLIRDLINTPADHMGPSELAEAARQLALNYQARFECIKNQDLEQNFPAIHAVGRASDDPPCLIKLSWAKNKAHPKIILVGKGVCFDTGGLDLKDPEGMRWMKKDMGGAAHVLGLAELIMQAELKINLEVYIPAVENSVAGNAYRPGDVVLTRQGLNIEIGNTDAEGRVILSDALCLASEQKPDLIIDLATLTGAARIALGADLPALFSNNDLLAQEILEMGLIHEDNLWRMPLYQPYKALLKSNIADWNNISKSSYGGAITAALFLESFIGENIPWCHIDLMAFNTSSRTARPEGGEAMGLRALFHMLEKRYG